MDSYSMPQAGSSPHTRGARAQQLAVSSAPGIIPAYAGSTPGKDSRSLSLGDHPRIRGEHDSLPNVPGSMVGSSPHTRGAPGPIKGRRVR